MIICYLVMIESSQTTAMPGISPKSTESAKVTMTLNVLLGNRLCFDVAKSDLLDKMISFT